MDGWLDRWVGVKAVLKIAYSSSELFVFIHYGTITND